MDNILILIKYLSISDKSKIISCQSIVKGWLIRKNIFNIPLVISWLNNGTYFNLLKKNKNNKLEKEFGTNINKKYFNYDKNTCQWTTCISENIVKLLLEKNGKKVRKPEKINNFQPDLETDDFVYEIKCRNYTTEGTIGEKILGVPYKYAEIPFLYKKPLRIITVAYQEVEAEKKFELFSPKGARKDIIEYWKTIGIEYIKCSDILLNKN